MEKQNYGFLTALSMVIGIVIGSGIFFKADDILLAVNGNILIGLAEFIVVGIGVLFGALTISYFALNDTNHIGLIGYSKTALGSRFAFITGWFSIACYFPAIIIVLAMVSSIYTSVLLGIDSKLFISITTLLFLIASFTINIFSPKSGGKIQVISTIGKIIPLIIIGLVGSLFFTSSESIGTSTTNTLSGGRPLTALITIAFAFDGWIVATNISSELKNSSKNLPRALAWGSIIILAIYCIYFFGITQIIDPQTIVSLGDAHTEIAAQHVVGPLGGKLLTFFVIVSVYGGLNGMTLAYLRLPNILVSNRLMNNIFGEDEKTSNRNTLLFTIFCVSFYFLLQQLIDYKVIFTHLDSSFDLSALPIIINYILYSILFILVNKLAFKEKIGKQISLFIISLIATLSAFIVIYGALQTNGSLYIAFSILVIMIGMPFYNKLDNK